MSKDKLIYIVIEGGLAAKPINPFLKPNMSPTKYPDVLTNPAWHKFDKAHPPLPLVSPLPVGTRVELGEPIWHVKLPPIGTLMALNADAVEDFKKQFPSREYVLLYPVAKNSDMVCDGCLKDIEPDSDYTTNGDAYFCHSCSIEAPTEQPVTPLVKEMGETLTVDKFFDLAHFSDVEIVNQYYKSIKAMHHNAEITKGIEEFANWQKSQQSTPEVNTEDWHVGGTQSALGDHTGDYMSSAFITNGEIILYCDDENIETEQLQDICNSLSNDRYSKLVGAIERRIKGLNYELQSDYFAMAHSGIKAALTELTDLLTQLNEK